jgi:ATP-dependent DNA ligase
MILDILEDLASNNSRLYKEKILTLNQNNETLKSVILLTLNPFVNFYIRKIPDYTLNLVSKKQDTLDKALLRLKLLSERTLTGNAGIEHLKIVLESVSPVDARVIERIIAKDLKCGVSEATVNKIWPGLIPSYPCMLASAYDQKLVDKIKFPAVAQLKMDGMRFNAVVKNGVCEFRSRNGKEVDIPDPSIRLPFIHMANFYGTDMVFDGELVVVDAAGKIQDRKTGNGILNKAVKGTMSVEEAVNVRATLWDAISLSGFQAGVENEPYHIRLGKLCNSISDMKNIKAHLGHYVDMVYSRQVDDLLSAQKLFNKFLSEGQEGIILKTRDGVWENKRSKSLIKFKGELECDLRVVGWEEGTGKNVGRLGALVLESDCGGIRVNVGTGFSDADRLGINSANSVGRIVAVKYNARITDKTSSTASLFLPVFVEFRSDKTEADHAKDIK